MNDLQDAVALSDELMPLKAWRLWQTYGDYCLLAFAPTRNKAKSLCVRQAPEDWSYQDIRSGHLAHLDTFADRERVIVCNEDLPAGCPPFWSEP